MLKKSRLLKSDDKVENIKVKDSMRKYKKYFIMGPIFKTFEAVFDLIIPLIMKNILDTISSGVLVTDSANLKYTLIGGLIILSLGILGFASTMVCQYMASVASLGVGTDLRNKIFRKVSNFSSKEFEKFSTSYLHNVLNADSVNVQTGVSMFIRLAFRAPLLIVGSLIISFIYSWEIALLFVGIIPIILLIIFVFMNKVAKKYQDIQKSLDDISTVTTDSLNGSRVIRAFNRQNYETVKFENYNNKYLQQGRLISFITAFINPLTFAVVNIVIIVIIYLTKLDVSQTVSVFSTDLEVTTIITLVNYLEQIFQALLVVSNLTNIFNKAINSSKRINEVFNVDVSIKNKGERLVKNINLGDEIIKFDHAYLSYEDGDNYALKDITFSLNKGESLGIIGGTGSGKSSLINLMMRYSDCSKGSVYYKGENIQEYDLPSLRNDYGLVLQKAILFTGTIKSNMQMADDSIKDEEITKAMKTSLAYEFVSKYDDYIEHPVVENGKNFSGGQRQRLSIARSLCKKNELLILDDSTSALDYLSDLNVRKNINENYKELTKIIISQRVSTVQNCDKIIVMENGCISGLGTHEELLKTNIIYRETYMSQQNGGKIDA